MIRKGRKIFWPLLAAGALMTLFPLARPYAGSDLFPSEPKKQPVYSVPHGPAASSIMGSFVENLQARVEVEEVTIRQHGFEPAEITRPVGRLILVVANPGGTNNLSLRLESEVGLRLLEVQVPRERPVWGDSLVLLPGRYLLTEANHPDWVCRINIR
jgi:hypothetical protein